MTAPTAWPGDSLCGKGGQEKVRKPLAQIAVRIDASREMLVVWGDADGNEYDALSLASDPVVIARSNIPRNWSGSPRNKFLNPE